MDITYLKVSVIVVKTKDIILLKPIYHLVGYKTGNIAIETDGNTYNELQTHINKPATGYYAAYREGIFIVFSTDDERVLIGWNQQLIDMDCVGEINWGYDRWKRWFSCKCIDKSSHMFIYNNIKLNPFIALIDAFKHGDDWWLVCDLPSFIETLFVEGNLRKSIISMKL